MMLDHLIGTPYAPHLIGLPVGLPVDSGRSSRIVLISKVQVDAPGSGTAKAPTGAFAVVEEAWGGGGGGGGNGRGGGSSGAYVRRTRAVGAGEELPYSVGGGGAKGLAAGGPVGPGANGTASTLDGIVAGGGIGGNDLPVSAGGLPSGAYDVGNAGAPGTAPPASGPGSAGAAPGEGGSGGASGQDGGSGADGRVLFTFFAVE